MPDLDKEDFTQAVYQMVRYVPKGRATSYGAIARAIGYPNMSRLVGRVLGQISSDKTIFIEIIGSIYPVNRIGLQEYL